MDKVYLPTQEQIRLECEEIRDGLSHKELEKRAKKSGSYATLHWIVPMVSVKATFIPVEDPR